jgi:hypothetical protein|tara:strand:+ start:17910 stop:18170 length:261 start_codon:yes stop_codon:yes gene_type:complete
MPIVGKKKTSKRIAPSKVTIKNPVLYIEMNFSIPQKQLDIRHLWGEFYRLNYWGTKEGLKGKIIIDSKFIKVSPDEEGNYTHKEYK